MDNDKNVELLKKFLCDKPKVSFIDSTSFPSEEFIYTMAGMKRYFRSIGLKNSDLDDALFKLQNDKILDLKSVYVYNHTYDQKFPYFYTSVIDNIKDIVELLEKKSFDLKQFNKKSSTKNSTSSNDDNLKNAIRRKK